MPAENYEDTSLMNSELRFITVELMKIAHEKRRPFDEVLTEYFQNAYKLKRRIISMHSPKSLRISIRPPRKARI